jgi:hypothetical protein
MAGRVEQGSRAGCDAGSLGRGSHPVYLFTALDELLDQVDLCVVGGENGASHRLGASA